MEEQIIGSVWFWLLLACLLIPQSTWLFLDARKRGSAPWFWGLWGLIQCPTPLVMYWIIVRWGLFSRKRGKKRN